MVKRANDEIVLEETKKVKTDIKHTNDPNEELVNAEAEKFLLLFVKTFSDHHENILKEENIGKSDNLDSEDGIVSDILTRETIHSEEAIPKVNKARKFQKIIDSFFHSIFDSKRNGKN